MTRPWFGFTPDGRGGVRRELRDWERALLTDLCGDLAALLAAADEAPRDRALARLLPDAYPGDAEASTEFRDFARPRLTGAKIESAQAVLDDLARPGIVTVPAARVPLWLRAVTDLRLVLAERSAERPDPALAEIGDWLGWVLSDLLEALDAGGAEESRDAAPPGRE